MSSDRPQPQQPPPEGNDHTRSERSKAKRRTRKQKKTTSSPAAPSTPPPASKPTTAKNNKTNNEHGQGKKSAQKKNKHHPRKKPQEQQSPPADMTVIVKRVQLWDALVPDASRQHHFHRGAHHAVAPYHFAPDVSCWIASDVAAASNRTTTYKSVNIVYAPRIQTVNHSHHQELLGFELMDTTFPNPHPPEVVHDKYWAQRRRLFSRFDMGIQLDAEGWFSVTPEIIADHVAERVGVLSRSAAFRRGVPGSELTESDGITILDAFCGCGGNAIAFGKLPSDQISTAVCVDIDRSKLQKAAYNASLYGIPINKLIFIECNTMFILGQCYKDGELQADALRSGDLPNMPDPVSTELHAGYLIGGLNLLPRRIDAIFMDPPWGGVDYFRLKEGYNLEKHMKIRVGPSHAEMTPPKAPPPPDHEELTDDFFDTFGPQQPCPQKCGDISFNETLADGEYVNGVELVKMAAAATKSRVVIYDLPRNTSKTSLGEAALAAGYRGNIKLEEHHLNGRLKTVTAYMGADYRKILE